MGTEYILHPVVQHFSQAWFLSRATRQNLFVVAEDHIAFVAAEFVAFGLFEI